MKLHWKRTLRTSSSDRFLAVDGERDLLAVDLHYLPDGGAAGSVIVLAGSGLSREDVPALLRAIDDDLLPGIDARDGAVQFTVVFGELVGNWQGDPAAS